MVHGIKKKEKAGSASDNQQSMTTLTNNMAALRIESNAGGQVRGFSKITLTEEHLSTVREFKPIVARGKSRESLDAKSHKNLVNKKCKQGQQVEDHVTLFRVSDKQTLSPKEKKDHTVQGPEWTPPSSVGYVMGALSQGDRVWLATPLTNDQQGLLSGNDSPSIYAREISVSYSYGWIPRSPKKGEFYGKTNKVPAMVLTPPTSPRDVPVKVVQNILDVDATWYDLPLGSSAQLVAMLQNMQKLSDHISSASDEELNIKDFDPQFLEIIVTADIMTLLEDKILNLLEMRKVSNDTLRELLYNDEVINGLQNEDFDFTNILELYIAAQNHKEDFGDVAIGFFRALHNGAFSAKEIIERYAENPMHLMFMGDDPDNIVLENSDDEEIVVFGIENYDIDIEWIKHELAGDKDDFSAAYMDFDRIIENHYFVPDEHELSCSGEFSDFSEYS